MDENEFILMDRIQKIQQIITKYGEENFYLSFSGGKDSTVLHHLLDMAIPGNSIPRVYANTGIEYKSIIEFVTQMQKDDERIVIIKPKTPIRQMLELNGYPFKSKEHSEKVASFRNGARGKWIRRYLGQIEGVDKRYICPDILMYQFEDGFDLKISDKCCNELKEKPVSYWAKDNKKSIAILGIRAGEGGRRSSAKCVAFTNTRRALPNHFNPLAPVSDSFEEWFIDKYEISLCDLYSEPYNFKRTGCKGCPFNPRLQDDLETMQKFFPNERKQCEIIWKPVYDEYRRIGYRLKPYEVQLDLFNEIDSVPSKSLCIGKKTK